ncbi:sugar transferase [Hoeflea sp.]|uniref:sugar transferase n=1 Tax=Hoeflea sp. TaxID=1940281 RepID=UPI003A94D918
MKILITGASGVVGQDLVPLLARPGVQLLLAGPDPEKLAALFPQCETCGDDEIVRRARGWDLLVHIAVDGKGRGGEARVRASDALLAGMADKARQAGIGRLLAIFPVHARGQLSQPVQIEGLDAVTVYVPLVHGARWAGRLSWLNPLPGRLARGLFGILAMLRPTLDVQRLADFILSSEQPGSGSETILSDTQQDNIWFAASKRLIDLVVAIGVFVVLWWAMALIWAVIRFQSPGPGIFAQTRIGRNGREFVCYKFRTMKLGTRQAGTHEITAAAITPFGRFLRATKLDELPQAWNILCNQMSLVGPRPCLPTQTALIEARERLGVLRIKPGITGLAQINGIDMSDPERLAEWDARYLALQSLRLDISIGLSTLLGSGQGDKVAR